MLLAFGDDSGGGGGGGGRPSVDVLIVVALSLLLANRAQAQEEHFIANQPKFQVLGRNELAVDLPLPAGRDLVTFRMGLQRSGKYIEAMEWGTNDVMKNGKVLIRDERLRLKDGDVINYLFGFRDQEGYQAQTGQYIFDGVFKRSRARRHTESISTAAPPSSSDSEQDSDSDSDTEEGSNMRETRFGGSHGRRGRWGHGHGHGHHGPGPNKKCDDFNPFAASPHRRPGGDFPNQFGPIRQPSGGHHGFPAQGFPPGPGFPSGAGNHQFYPHNNRPHHGGHHGHYHHGHGRRRGGWHHGHGRPNSDECNDENDNGDDNNNNDDDNNETTTALPNPTRTTPGTRNPSPDYPDIDIRFGNK